MAGPEFPVDLGSDPLQRDFDYPSTDGQGNFYNSDLGRKTPLSPNVESVDGFGRYDEA